jgi:hypothetical protein
MKIGEVACHPEQCEGPYHASTVCSNSIGANVVRSFAALRMTEASFFIEAKRYFRTPNV